MYISAINHQRNFISDLGYILAAPAPPRFNVELDGAAPETTNNINIEIGGRGRGTNIEIGGGEGGTNQTSRCDGKAK